MLNIKRFSQRSSSHVQSLLTLSITATLAFTLGAVTGPVGSLFVQAPALVDQPSQAARVAPVTNFQPALAAAPSEAAAVRVPYEAGWELYDGGWAGGPAFKMPAVVRVPYEMGWELYDGGYAGGPNTLPAAFQVALVAPATSIQPATSARSDASVVRVPYEAGWELYDGGWAGGPAFKMPTVVRVPYEMGWELYDGGWAGGPNTFPATSNQPVAAVPSKAAAGSSTLSPEDVRTLPFRIQNQVAGTDRGATSPVAPSSHTLRPEYVVTLPAQIQSQVQGMAATSSALRPEYIVTLPHQIQVQVARQGALPAHAATRLAPEDVRTLPWQIQEQVR